MAESGGLGNIVESQRVNAALGWVLVAFLVVAAVSEFLSGALIWTGLILSLAVLAVVPPVVHRSPRVMLPWEVVGVAALPAIGRVVVIQAQRFGFPLTGRLTTYLAVAAVALIIAVELDLFTPVQMNYSFAVLFVVVTTMAAAGVWAIVQWLSDLYLGTAFLLTGAPEHEIETALMWDFVAATVAGVLAGLLFEFYFRRRSRTSARLPDEVGGADETR